MSFIEFFRVRRRRFLPIFSFLFSIFSFVVMFTSIAAAQQPAVAGEPRVVSEAGPRELLRKLDALRVDSAQVYRVRELTLRRDAVRIGLEEGKLAFLAAQDGHVTGAVFSGQGHIVAVPRDPVEKRSLARFLGKPLLDESFSRAYFRFTDNTAEEFRAQLTRSGSQPFAEASFAEDWNPTVANLNPQQSLRILMDLLDKEPPPYFYAGIAGDVSGAFEVLVDDRRTEQVRIGQIRFVEGAPFFDTWTSFARADQPAPAAPFEPLGYRIETTIPPSRNLEGITAMELRTMRGGARIVPLELSRRLSVTEVTDGAGRALPFFKSNELTPTETAMRGDDAVSVVLPEAPTEGQSIQLRLKYNGSVPSDTGDPALVVGALGSWYAHTAGARQFVPFDLSFRWPRRIALTATGKKLEEHEDGEWRTGKWASNGPIPSARFNLGGLAWGDELGDANYRDQWIQVGLSSYGALMSQEEKDPGELPKQLESYRRTLAAEDENETLDSIGPLVLGYRLNSSKSPRAYSRLVRPKSIWVMHMLRMMLREPDRSHMESVTAAPAVKRPGTAKSTEPPKVPDERFVRLLQALVANGRHLALTTEDLQREVEKVMTPEMDLEGSRKNPGRPGAMDWFFDQWVRGTGIPKYSVEIDAKPAGDKFILRGKLKQSGVLASFLAPVPIYAPREAEGTPVLLGTVVTNGAETPFQFTVRAAPKKLLIDPNHMLLCLTE